LVEEPNIGLVVDGDPKAGADEAEPKAGLLGAPKAEVVVAAADGTAWEEADVSALAIPE
jgi:hypothetical protein